MIKNIIFALVLMIVLFSNSITVIADVLLDFDDNKFQSSKIDWFVVTQHNITTIKELAAQQYISVCMIPNTSGAVYLSRQLRNYNKKIFLVEISYYSNEYLDSADKNNFNVYLNARAKLASQKCVAVIVNQANLKYFVGTKYTQLKLDYYGPIKVSVK